MSTNTKLAEALRKLLRYSDGIICYASTMGEHEPNKIVHEAQQALAAHDAEQAAKAVPAGLYVGLIERLMKLSTRLGIAYEGGVEHFAASLEDRLYAICRSAEGLLDSLAAAPTPPAPEAPADTEAVTACWQDFGRTNEFRRAVKWSQDGEIPGALFVAFRAGLRAASPKALCDCGKKPAAECDKWEPGCDLGQSPEHARVVRLDKAQAAPEAQQAAGKELAGATTGEQQ